MEEDMLLDSLAVDGGLVDGHVKGRLSEERLVNLYEHLRYHLKFIGELS